MQILFRERGLLNNYVQNNSGIHVFYVRFLELLWFVYQSIKHVLNPCASFQCRLMTQGFLTKENILLCPFILLFLCFAFLCLKYTCIQRKVLLLLSFFLFNVNHVLFKSYERRYHCKNIIIFSWSSLKQQCIPRSSESGKRFKKASLLTFI